MNKIVCTALLSVAALAVDAQSTSLPYASDLGVNYGIDPDWTHVNNGRRGAKGFTYDRDADYTTPGTSGGICHAYDMDYDANCWVFSPAFDLVAGQTYTVGLWAKTKGADSENFKICYGTGKSAADMTTTLLDKKFFKSADDFTHFEETFTVEANSTVYIGIQCYSDANSYNLTLTGFTLSGEGGGGGDDPVKPDDPAEALPLPFVYTFNNGTDYSSKWTNYAGPDAYTQSPWTLNSYSGWAVFDVAEYEKEDNWLISPLLSFDAPGTYSLTYTGLISGKLEFLIGTDATDVSTFTLIATEELDSYDNDTEYNHTFDVAEAGNYHIAVRAAADAGSFMGYRMKKLDVRSDKAVPAIVEDLTAFVAGDDLEVNLMWTNPTVDHRGNALESITKLELYRNGVMIKDDFPSLNPGGINAWLDTPEAAGTYSYYVVAYNENGCTTAPARVVDAGFVGHPVASLPYNYSPEETDMFALFTVADANDDGTTWRFTADDDYTFWNKLELKSDVPVSHDDYLVTPYFALEAGYYSLTLSANMRSHSIELGYVTDRHDPAGTFVKFAAVDNYSEYSLSDYRRVFAVSQDGDYALCIHAVGRSTSPSDLNISIKEINIDAARQLPGSATDLKATDLEPEEGFAVELTWVNPAVDNAGVAMSADTRLTASVYRNDALIATLDGDDCLPGAAMTYTDSDIAAAGNYTYAVVISSANGESEDAPAAATLYVGPSVALPYATLDFSQWQFADPDNYYNWDINADGTATWEKSWGHSKYTIFTPYVRIEPDKQYMLTATFDGREDYTMDMHLLSAYTLDEEAVELCHSFTVPVEAVDHELSVVLTPGVEAVAPLAAREAAGSVNANVPSGKLVLGFRPAETGKITLKSFALSVHDTSGIGTTVAASQGTLCYAAGVVSCPDATAITVCDTAGRVLLSVTGNTADLSTLAGAGCVVVTAPGHKALKIVL